MYYFDNNLLKQYIDQNKTLKVFADGKWYSITDVEDVADPVNGVGYNEYGADFRFDYKDIEKVKTGQWIITLEKLQTMMTGKEPEGDKPKKEPAKKEPELAHYDPHQIGRDLIKEFRRNKT